MPMYPKIYETCSLKWNEWYSFGLSFIFSSVCFLLYFVWNEHFPFFRDNRLSSGTWEQKRMLNIFIEHDLYVDFLFPAEKKIFISVYDCGLLALCDKKFKWLQKGMWTFTECRLIEVDLSSAHMCERPKIILAQ